jgi:hypothetical protein
MKKAFPVLWRYILVVIMSCALAFFISQNTAKATESIQMQITNPSIGAVFEPVLPRPRKGVSIETPLLIRLYESAFIGVTQKPKGEI